MPQAPYIPTDEQRRTVRTMAAFGVPQDHIARVVQCSDRTLRKAFRHELDTAVVEANARVAGCLFQQATTPGNIAATIFWLKARAGWREKQLVEVAGPDGAPAVPQKIVVEFVEAQGPWNNADLPAARKQIEGDRR